MARSLKASSTRFDRQKSNDAAALALQRDPHVLEHGQMREHRRDLERAHQPEPRHVGRRQRRDVAALVDDAAAGRAQELGQQVEAGGLAGAVRSDQRMNGAAGNAQVHPVDRDEAGEFLGEVLGTRMKSSVTSPSPVQSASSRLIRLRCPVHGRDDAHGRN